MSRLLFHKSFSIFALLTVALTPCAAAQAGDDDAGKPLTVNVARGKKITFRQVIRMDDLVEGERSAIAKRTVARDVTFESLGTLKTGGTRFKCTFDRARASSLAGLSGIQLLNFDSDDAEQHALTLALVLEHPACALGGATFYVTLGPRGEVLEVEGVDKARPRIVQRLAASDASFAKFLEDYITAERVGTEVSSLLLLTPLPEGPVGTGTAWSVADRLDPSDGIAVDLKAQFRVMGVFDGFLGLGATIEPRTVPGRDPAKLWNGMAVKPGETTADADWTGSVSSADGLPRAYELGLRFSVDTDAGVVIERRMCVALTRVVPGAKETEDAFLEARAHPATASGEPSELEWCRRRALYYRDVTWPGKMPQFARPEFERGLKLGRAAIAKRPDDQALRTAYAYLLYFDASFESGEEQFDAALALWKEAIAVSDALRKSGNGRSEFLEFGIEVRRRLASDTASKGDVAKALGLIAAAHADAVDCEKRAPGNKECAWRRLDVLLDWARCHGLAGDPRAGLAKGLEAFAVRDRISIGVPQSLSGARKAGGQATRIAELALEAGDAQQAAALFERAKRGLDPHAYDNEDVKTECRRLGSLSDGAQLVASGDPPKNARQRVAIGEVLYLMKRFGAAIAQFTSAFEDAAVRTSDEGEHLRTAIRAAARAHGAASPSDKPALAQRAFEWLEIYKDFVREGFMGDVPREQRARFAAASTSCRTDPAFESLTSLPEWKELFPDPPK